MPCWRCGGACQLSCKFFFHTHTHTMPVKVKILVPMAEWKRYLQLSFTKCETLQLDDIALPSNHPQILQQLVDFQEKHKAREGGLGGIDVCGRGWPKCFQQHSSTRQICSKIWDVIIPTPEESIKLAIADSQAAGDSWLHLLSCREIDVLNIQLMICRHGLNYSNPEAMAFHWDLGHSLKLGRNKHLSNLGVLPCITKKHTLWDVVRRKPWSGMELLLAQGFREDMKLSACEPHLGLEAGIEQTIRERLGKEALLDQDLRNLAGNTMTVPIMMMLQV
jgi:hypothetical protein